MTVLLTYWRILLPVALLLLAGAVIGISRHQLDQCRLALAEHKRAYDLLAQSVQRQNQSIQEAERAATAAAQRGAQARRDAQGAIDVATKSADALQRAMAAPGAPSTCPAGDGLAIVRADLTR